MFPLICIAVFGSTRTKMCLWHTKSFGSMVQLFLNCVCYIFNCKCSQLLMRSKIKSSLWEYFFFQNHLTAQTDLRLAQHKPCDTARGALWNKWAACSFTPLCLIYTNVTAGIRQHKTQKQRLKWHWWWAEILSTWSLQSVCIPEPPRPSRALLQWPLPAFHNHNSSIY